MEYITFPTKGGARLRVACVDLLPILAAEAAALGALLALDAASVSGASLAPSPTLALAAYEARCVVEDARCVLADCHSQGSGHRRLLLLLRVSERRELEQALKESSVKLKDDAERLAQLLSPSQQFRLECDPAQRTKWALGVRAALKSRPTFPFQRAFAGRLKAFARRVASDVARPSLEEYLETIDTLLLSSARHESRRASPSSARRHGARTLDGPLATSHSVQIIYVHVLGNSKLKFDDTEWV